MPEEESSNSEGDDSDDSEPENDAQDPSEPSIMESSEDSGEGEVSGELFLVPSASEQASQNQSPFGTAERPAHPR